MKAFFCWVGIVMTTTAAGGVFGWVLGQVIRVVNIETLVFVREFVETGLRTGCLLGTVLGAAAIVGSRPLPRVIDIFKIGGWLSVGLGLATLAGGALGLAAAQAHILPQRAGIDRQVGHASRVLLSSGLEWGAIVGVVLCGVAGCVLIRARRGNQRVRDPALFSPPTTSSVE